jgi:ribosomal protein S27E
VSTTPDPETVREIAREYVLDDRRRAHDIAPAILGRFGPDGLTRPEYRAYCDAVREAIRTATVTVSWPAELGKTGTLQFRACQSPNGPLIDWQDVVAGESAMIIPWPDSAGRIRVDFRKVACRSCGTTERVFGDPPLCSNCAVYGAGLAKGADATGTALSATETSELQFEASAPATKPEGAQRGAQGLCESERNDETGTER